MSGLTKKILLIAGIMAIAGSALAFAAFAMGADTSVYWDSGFKVADAQRYDFNEVLSDFDNIDLNMDIGDVIIKTSDTFRIEGYYYGPQHEIRYSVENGILSVTSESEEDGFWISNFSLSSIKSGNVVIYVPENTELKSVGMKLDAGSVTVENIAAVSFAASLELGDLKMTDSVLNNADVSCSAGRVSGKNLSMNSGEIENNLGDVSLSGVFTGTIDISCDMGSLALDVDGYKNEYSYRGAVDIGDIKIDGQSQPGSVEQSIENSIGSINFEISVGDAKINFTQK